MQSNTIVILGAGDIGSAVARQLAAADVATRVVLADESGSVAQGKALDIAQAAPVDRYSTAVSGTTDFAAVVGAGVVVLADQAVGGEWHGDAGLALLKRVAAFNQTAFIVCAGARQESLVERGVLELGIAPGRLCGSAPEALRSAVISMVALEAGVAPAEIALLVLGRPPAEIVVPWDEASVGGQSAPRVLSTAALARLDARLPRLWPSGSLALAAAATRLIRAGLTRSSRQSIAFISVERMDGRAGKVAMLPVMMSPAGVARVIVPSLATRDRVRLDTVLHR